MRLLVCLAERAGQVVSIDELLDQVWAGVIVTPDSVYQGIAALRRHLADDPKEPSYIATVPRRGYRMIAAVSPWTDVPVSGMGPSIDSTLAKAVLPAAEPPPKPRQRFLAATLVAAIILATVAAYLVRSRPASPQVAGSSVAASPGSVAVLPFLGLPTGAVNEE